MSILRNKPWSPYVAGALAGLLLCVSVVITGKYFGTSTTYVRTAGLIEQSFIPKHVTTSAYFAKTKIKIDWQMMFVVGIVLGSMAAAMLSGSFTVRAVPPMWTQRFGSSIVRRFVVAFFGGIIVMFGARLAGG